MKLSRNRNWLLSAILFLSLTDCASKPPPDVFAFKHLKQQLTVDETGSMKLRPSPICMKEIGEFECGYGVSIMTGREVFVGNSKNHLFNGKTWDEIVEESIFLPSEESYSPLSAHIINSCKAMHCSDEVGKFKVKLDKLQRDEDVRPKKEDLKGASVNSYMLPDIDMN